MIIHLLLEIHAYVEEKLCDEYFDSPPYYGIHGPEIMLPLAKGRGSIIKFEYNENTKMSDMVDCIKKAIGIDSPDYSAPIRYAIIIESERYFFEPKANFKTIIDKYVGPVETDPLNVCLLISCNAGCICEEDGLRYFVRSREGARHKKPHIHVETVDHNEEISLSIENGEILGGNLNKKLLKKARKKIEENKSYFYDCWAKKTDGLLPDINHHFNLINY